jgi:hypothetical protein
MDTARNGLYRKMQRRSKMSFAPRQALRQGEVAPQRASQQDEVCSKTNEVAAKLRSETNFAARGAS